MSGEKPRRIAARRAYSVSYRGKTLLSVIDPIAQALRIVEALQPINRTLYFCPSPLLGYGLSEALEKIRLKAPDSAILCLEADGELFSFSREAMDGSLLADPRLRLTDTADPAALCGFVRRTWGARRFRRIETLRFSGGWRLFPERYQALEDSLRQDIALDWGNAMTLAKLGRRYMRNALRNLPLLAGRRNLADLSFGRAPLLVLGAGPSLDGILKGLEAACTGCLDDPAARPFRIICADTCLASLRARNIKPDLAVALECQHWNLRDFAGLGDWELPVAMDLSALPATAETLGKRTYLFFTPWTPLRIFRRLDEAGLLPEQFPPLGSVGLTAVGIGLRLSGGPVFTGGIDFSFTLDSYHARSTPGHREKLRKGGRFKSILNAEAAFRAGVFAAPGKSGAAVLSDPGMRGYRDLFEREFGGRERLWDLRGTGLPLGLETLEPAEAFVRLASAEGEAPVLCVSADHTGGEAASCRKEKLRIFIGQEKKSLTLLRNILKGEAEAGETELEGLLDEEDFLWAHFPDCAGAEGRRPRPADLSFLKRVRMEIDPFIGLLEMSLEELAGERHGIKP